MPKQRDKILVVTPLQAELDSVLAPCVAQGFAVEATTIGRLPAFHLPELGMTLACGGVGKAQFAAQTQHLLDSAPGIDLAICAGAAGALVDDLAIGDVVVATSTVEHDYDNRFTDKPAPRFECPPEVLRRLRHVEGGLRSFQVHFGTVASGDEDVVDPARRAALQMATGALAVAWEGAGGAKACGFSGVPYLELRGVTDLADSRAPADFEANLARAMVNVGAVIMAWRCGAGD